MEDPSFTPSTGPQPRQARCGARESLNALYCNRRWIEGDGKRAQFVFLPLHCLLLMASMLEDALTEFTLSHSHRRKRYLDGANHMMAKADDEAQACTERFHEERHMPEVRLERDPV